MLINRRQETLAAKKNLSSWKRKKKRIENMNDIQSKDPNDEILEIPHGETIRIFELTISARTAWKHLKLLPWCWTNFSPQLELKTSNCSISGIKTHFETCWGRTPLSSWPSKVKHSAKSCVWIEIFYTFTRNELHYSFTMV